MLFFSKSSFRRRLLFAGASLLGFALLAAVTLYFSVREYSYHLERSSLAQRVYSSYQAVSDHTYRKLNAMGEIVAEGSVSDLEARYANQKALREALQEVHDSVAAEFAHVGDAGESTELDQLIEIERLAETIIRGSHEVRTALQEDRREDAQRALENLRGKTVEGRFTNLIDVALAEEQREVFEAEKVVRELGDFVTNLVPYLLGFSLVVGAALIYAMSHALTRSMNALESATKQYAQGNFDHRVEQLAEVEFAGLANALNKMASELASRRERERISQENLESLVKVRTRELQQSNAKLAAVSETRKQFLADISHELRTPLTIIQGESDMALRGEVKTPEQYIDAISRVKEQAVHTARLVHDLLFIARAEEGKASINKRSVAIIPIVQEVCSNFRTIAAERRIEIVEYYDDTQLVANVDPGRIQQAVTILLDNAVRYSDENSQVAVQAEKVEHQIVLSVIDSGIGLDANDAEQVFSRFYRGGAASLSATGTGLGLPVAKAIVDAHGGEISLLGMPGRGTTATIKLPLERQLRAIQ